MPPRRRVVLNQLSFCDVVPLNGMPANAPLTVCDDLMSEKLKSESVPITTRPN